MQRRDFLQTSAMAAAAAWVIKPDLAAAQPAAAAAVPGDPAAEFQDRARHIVSRMTLNEKIGQMTHLSPAIERLGIVAHTWWNECLHGVARAGIATVFPQAIGLAATFDEDLMFRVADVISTEARAKHHEAARLGDTDFYKGLTFWSPNINILRDPRWGRGHETYGECPWLTGMLGVAFVRGLQGNDPKYFKVIATPKHFAVHSGPEISRHEFNAVASAKDIRETYLPHFRRCVQEGGAWSVMGAYNRLNGEPCCASKMLLQQILREEWGFPGYVVSDCGGIGDLNEHQHVTNSAPESAALAVKNGCDLECGHCYPHLVEAAAQGLISEAEIDVAVTRLMEARLRLGMLDPPEQVAFARIPLDVVDCEAHRALSLEAAQKSLVLLKNNGALPIPKSVKTIAVIGPNAYEPKVLLGNYHGTPSRTVTPLEAIRARVGDGVKVLYTPGCDLLGKHEPWLGKVTRGFSEAQSMAERADVVIAVMGLSAEIEGEQGDAFNSDAGGDRMHLNLTGQQQPLLELLAKTGKPVILILINGGALAVNFAQDHCAAILACGYPGQEGGTAIAGALFGDFSPSGKLPMTWYKSLDQVPPFESYAMQGRTYRYIDCDPLYPFGFGLSYTRFEYSEIAVQQHADGRVIVEATIRNAGSEVADEMAQLYVAHQNASVATPICNLRGVQRVSLAPGDAARLRFELFPQIDLTVFDEDGSERFEAGEFEISIGGGQPDARSASLGAAEGVKLKVKIV